MPWIDAVAGVLQAWYPGQEAGNAIADVVTGRAEPGGRLPQSFPEQWSDNPTHSQDREVYPGLNGKVRYEEGLFVGYRHYDKTGTAPLFPFGFGLSYTSFDLSAPQLDDRAFEADGRVTVSVDVTNTGPRSGSTVLQLYISDRDAGLPRPAKELKAFVKVALGAGESQRATLDLNARDFAYFDPSVKQWLVEKGEFVLHLALSAAETVASLQVSRRTTIELPI